MAEKWVEKLHDEYEFRAVAYMMEGDPPVTTPQFMEDHLQELERDGWQRLTWSSSGYTVPHRHNISAQVYVRKKQSSG